MVTWNEEMASRAQELYEGCASNGPLWCVMNRLDFLKDDGENNFFPNTDPEYFIASACVAW